MTTGRTVNPGPDGGEVQTKVVSEGQRVWVRTTGTGPEVWVVRRRRGLRHPSSGQGACGPTLHPSTTGGRQGPLPTALIRDRAGRDGQSPGRSESAPRLTTLGSWVRMMGPGPSVEGRAVDRVTLMERDRGVGSPDTPLIYSTGPTPSAPVG